MESNKKQNRIEAEIACTYTQCKNITQSRVIQRYTDEAKKKQHRRKERRTQESIYGSTLDDLCLHKFTRPNAKKEATRSERETHTLQKYISLPIAKWILRNVQVQHRARRESDENVEQSTREPSATLLYAFRSPSVERKNIRQAYDILIEIINV